MAKKGKKSTVIPQRKKQDKSFVGTINGNELLINRKGKINPGLNPEMRGAVHGSVKDYNRGREKREFNGVLREMGY